MRKLGRVETVSQFCADRQQTSMLSNLGSVDHAPLISRLQDSRGYDRADTSVGKLCNSATEPCAVDEDSEWPGKLHELCYGHMRRHAHGYRIIGRRWYRNSGGVQVYIDSNNRLATNADIDRLRNEGLCIYHDGMTVEGTSMQPP